MESYENAFKKQDNSTEKQLKLNESRQEVNRIIDKLGLGVDEGIKETIAVLRAMDFPTSSSCAGHTEPDSFGPPYVEVYAVAPVGWKEDKQRQAIWRAENLKHRDRLLELVNEFYKQRNVIEDARLEIDNIGAFGGFRLQAKGTYMKTEGLGIKNQEDIFNRIKLYQNEIGAFTDFLKERFLKNK